MSDQKDLEAAAEEYGFDKASPVFKIFRDMWPSQSRTQMMNHFIEAFRDGAKWQSEQDAGRIGYFKNEFLFYQAECNKQDKELEALRRVADAADEALALMPVMEHGEFELKKSLREALDAWKAGR